MSRDAVQSARALLKSPLFSLVTVLTLALGIGGAAAVFTVLNAVVIRPLPIERPEQLYAVERRGNGAISLFSWPFVEQLRTEFPAGTELFAATRPVSMQVRIEGRNDAAAVERSMIELVSGEYFTVLRQRAHVGRLLDASDNAAVGSHPVAVISDSYWTRRFGRTADVLGRRLTIGGSSLTIVGVAPPGFSGPFVSLRNAEVWVPLMMQPAIRYAFNAFVASADTRQPWPPQRDIEWLRLFVRAPTDDARAEATGRLGLIFEREIVARIPDSDSERRAIVAAQRPVLEGAARGVSRLRTEMTSPLLVLLAMVGVLLAITSGNVAGLLLARGTARQREIAIRVAIGAGRWRVIRQQLIEALTLAVAGGALGLLVAAWGRDALLAIGGRGADLLTLDVSFDWRVLGFVLAATLLSGVAAGLVPALRSTGVAPTDALKTDTRQAGAGTRRSVFVGKALVSAQIAFSLVLLIVAGLFVRSMQSILATDVGYDRRQLLTARVDLRSPGYSAAERQALYRRLVERLERLPGVESASLSLNGPLATSMRSSSLAVDGYTPAPGERLVTNEEVVTAGYFDTVGLRIVEGRGFIASDARPESRSTIINQSMASRFFPGTSPVGRRWSYGDGIEPDSSVIVGVVEDAAYRDVREAAPNMIYHLADASPDDVLGSVEIRTSTSPGPLAQTVTQALREAEPGLPLFDVVPLEERMNRGISTDRLIAQLTGVFGGLALLLACLGLYGTISYGVTRRRTEIGVRIALGASAGTVLWLVVREALLVVVAGACIGVPLALAAGRGLRSMLYGIGPVDPASYAAGIATLFAVALLAASIPAVRASRTDPMLALRE